MATLPGPDGLALGGGQPVAAEAHPSSGLSLTTVGSPTRGAVRVALSGPARAHLRVEVVDLRGRVVAVLHEGGYSGALTSLSWAGGAPGAYLVRIAGEPIGAQVTIIR